MKNSSAGIIELDVHGMTKYQAKILIDNQVRKAGGDVYRIRVIHGFRSGTELRDMVRREYKNNPRVKRVEHALNPGTTELVLREWY